MVKNVRIWFRVDGVFVKEVQNAIKGEFNQMSVSLGCLYVLYTEIRIRQNCLENLALFQTFYE